VYSICAGAGFATLENLMYVAQYGLATGIVRGFVSVPLHCTTAAIIGLNLSNKRPVEIAEGQSCVESHLIDSACTYIKSKCLYMLCVLI
jgi:RsiW-degrading membrane proteinase PrsW (M82 family)